MVRTWLWGGDLPHVSDDEAVANMGHPLVEGVDGQAAEEFGVEVGGFLGQDFAGKCDVANLLHANWIHQEGGLRFAAADLCQRVESLY